MRKIYVADFETSYDSKTNEAWVWSYGFANIDDEKVVTGGNIHDFIEHMKSFTHNTTTYFHNLKFDGRYILYYLLKNGYKHTFERIKEAMELTYIVDDVGTFYMISFGYVKNGKVLTATFLDSFKKLPFSLEKIAKGFKLPVSKLEMDYSIIRYENHKLSKEEQDYLDNDVIILAKAIKIMYDRNYKRLTIGSDSLHDFKQGVNTATNNKKAFDIIFPKITHEQDGFIRKAYRGGVCYLKKDMVSVVSECYSYDVNSMYPAMLKHKLLPYGSPKRFDGKYEQDNEYPLYVQRISCEFFIKDKRIPTIQLKGSTHFLSNEWVENSGFAVEMTLTNIDLELFLDSYDVVDLEYHGGYKFKAKKGLFDKYIDEHYATKEYADNDVDRFIAKLFLNNLYGKFGSRPDRLSQVIEINEKGVLGNSRLHEVETDLVYLPIAVFTTSYARFELTTACNQNYDNFIYCDTDCIHTKKEAVGLDFHDSELGKWCFEWSGKAKHLKAKTYIYQEIDDEKPNIVCAGLNKKMIPEKDYDFDEFYLGKRYDKLMGKNVVGGVALVITDHVIS